MSKTTAMFIAKFMIFLYKIFRVKPWITPLSVNIFTNKEKVSISKAKTLLGYKSKINYDDGMKRVEKWLKKQNYIP
jgi:nucleoside-diphosphate-sugar epimerase